MIFNPNKPSKYTKASTMVIPLSDGTGTENYYCPYLRNCNLTYEGLKFAAFLRPEGWLIMLSPDGDCLEMSYYPSHPQGYGQHFTVDRHLGNGYYEKCTSFKHLGKRLIQSDLANTEIFNEERLRSIKWDLRWQTEGLAVVNGNYRNMKEYQESLREEMEEQRESIIRELLLSGNGGM